MPVMGAIVTFSTDPSLRHAAELNLSHDAAVTLGPTRGARRALVIETSSTGEEKLVIERLLADPGVVDLQVASHDITDLIAEPEDERDDDPGTARS
jgi:hypothetical protein